MSERERLFAKLKEVPFLEPYPSHANFILAKVWHGAPVGGSGYFSSTGLFSPICRNTFVISSLCLAEQQPQSCCVEFRNGQLAQPVIVGSLLLRQNAGRLS